MTRSRIAAALALATLCATVSAFGPTTAWAQGRATLTPGDTLLFESERKEMQEQLSRSVFRVIAEVLPPEPYEQTAMRYDGAAVAIEHDGLAFITTAAWLVSADRIVLVDDDDELTLEVVLLDVRYDLALLRFASGAQPEAATREFRPLPIADMATVSSYTLLSPQTRYEVLAAAVVIAQDNDEGGLYWTTTLAAANGYPLITADGRLIALQARRSASQPSARGIAVGWPAITDFLHPPEGLANAREPDHVVQKPSAQGRNSQQPTTRKGARLTW